MTDQNPTSQDELRQLFKKHAHSCGKLGDVCTCLDRQELEMLIEDIATHYAPKTKQPQRIKYHCPSCSRQELVLHDGWLFCGNLECKSPDAMDALIEPRPSKENPDVR